MIAVENQETADNKKIVFIVGFMGSGKTTWGRKLAHKAGWDFIDLDTYISDKTGMPIPDYFEQYGEVEFRKLESQTLKSLSFNRPTVVSTGGGTPCFFDNMQWMNETGITVFFQLPAKALWGRLMKSDITSRPALNGLTGDQLLQHIEAKLTDREPHYRKAKHTVNQLDLTVEQLVRLVQ